MWGIEYTDEAKFYFLDNYPYTFPLLVRIEELRYEPEAVPQERCIEIEPGLLMWEALNHLVYYRREQGRIVVAAIKPL